MTQLLGAGDLEQGGGDVLLVVRIDQAAGGAADFGPGAGSGTIAGTTRGERLQDGQPEALEQRGQHETIGQLVGAMQALVGHEADEMDAREIRVRKIPRAVALISATRHDQGQGRGLRLPIAAIGPSGARCCRRDSREGADVPVC